MKDQNALAYINMFAILKQLELLCKLDEQAKALAAPQKPTSISFNVAKGPKATLKFENGKCTMSEGMGRDIKLRLSSPQAFNKMIEGEKSPLPYSGFLKLQFLFKNFMPLTEILNSYLRAKDEDLNNRVFFEKSTTMLFYVVANALSQLGNYDEIAKISSSKIPNGSISMEIANGPCAEIIVLNGQMHTFNRKAKNPRAYMIFSDFDTVHSLFNGVSESMSALASGQIVMKGYIPMIDNLNKILTRVAVYLA